uniref:Uncharacterized protein n=1 Tax=Kalanchoe fedtschenkoi TaxID=63787 RepID=A0A7N0T2N4_KALFE
MGGELDQLAEEDRKALRGSKFAPLPSLSSTSRPPQPRLAHPGGPLRTNKAAALAKFLERKLQDPNGLASLNPDLIELAVKNAKETVKASSSGSGKVIQHVTSFDDPEVHTFSGDIVLFCQNYGQSCIYLLVFHQFLRRDEFFRMLLRKQNIKSLRSLR